MNTIKTLITALLLLVCVEGFGQVSVSATAGTASGSYATLNAAFAAINAGTHQGTINISITGNTTEPSPPTSLVGSGIGSASYTSINISPSGGSWTVNSAALPFAYRGIIELFGARHVTIDGDPSGTGSRHLTFQVAQTTNLSTSAIRMASTDTTGLAGAAYDTVRNCNIIGGRDSANSAVPSYGIIVSGNSNTSVSSPAAFGCNFNSFINNNFKRSYYAIALQGEQFFTSVGNNNTLIRNNMFGSDSATTSVVYGIYMFYFNYTQSSISSDIGIIDSNDFTGNVSLSGTDYYAIYNYVNTGNLTISNNRIHDISNSSAGIWGYYSNYSSIIPSRVSLSFHNNTMQKCIGQGNTSGTCFFYSIASLGYISGGTWRVYNNNADSIISVSGNTGGIVFPYGGGLDTLICNDNVFTNLTASKSAWGISAGLTANSFTEVYRNVINGIKVKIANQYALAMIIGGPAHVYNNMIGNISSVPQNTAYALFAVGSNISYIFGGGNSAPVTSIGLWVKGSNVQVYDNTIALNTPNQSGAVANAFSAAILGGASGDRYQNNIVYNNQNSTNAYAFYASVTAGGFASDTLDYNAYYAPYGNIGYASAPHASLLSWQAATSQDLNAVSGSVPFVTNGNLHIDTTSVSDSIVFRKGVGVSYISTDIDIQTRHNPPCIGADEFNLTPFSAGPDQSICANTTAIMAAIGTGTWTNSVGSPGPVQIDSATSPTTTIRGFSQPGVYALIWSNASSSDTMLVTVNTAPVADYTLANLSDTFSTCPPAIVNPFIDNSTGAAQYSWNFGDGTPADTSSGPSHVWTIPGTYPVTEIVTSATGCADSITKYRIHIAGPLVTMTASVQPSCTCTSVTYHITSVNASSLIFTSSGGSPAFSMINVSPAGTSANPAHDSITVEYCNAGTVLPSIQASGGSCTSIYDSLIVPITISTAAPSVSISAPDSIIIPGQSAALTAIGTPAGGSYQWAPLGALLPAAGNTPTITATPSSTITYRVVYTLGGCYDTTYQTIHVYPVYAGPDQTVSCATLPGGTATMAALGSGTWTASTGNPGTATITSPTDSVTTITTFGAPGIYHFVWNDGLGRTDTADVIVTARPNAGPDQAAVCVLLPGGSVTMAGTGTGTWSALASNPGTASITTPISPITTITNFSAAGVYNFIWTNSSGCTDTALVTIVGKPNAGTDQTVNLGAVATMAAAGIGTWTASSGNPTTSTITNPTSATTTISDFLMTGTYSYIWTSFAGCTDTANVIVSANSACGFVANQRNGCASYTLNLHDTTSGIGSSGTNWIITTPSGSVTSISNNNQASALLTAPGRYTVHMTNTHGCDIIDSGFSVLSIPVITDSLTNPSCYGMNNGSICAHVSGSGPFSYSWSNGSIVSGCLTNIAAGTYWLTVTDQNGCTSSQTDTILQPAPVSVTVLNDTICAGQSATLTALLQVAGGTFLWSPGGATTASITVSPGASASYSVIYSLGLCSGYDTAVVIVNSCTPDSTVWPGDADNNRLVDNNDLLPIGMGYDSMGTARIVQSIVWQADGASDWRDSFTSYTPAVNYKHADCNGDGLINYADTTAIIQNFSLTHAKSSGPAPWRSGLPALKAVLSRDTLYVGDTLYVNFVLGDSITTIADFYGLAFTYNFDPQVVDSTKTTMTFGPSWIGSATDKISISKTLNSTGEIKAAVTRIDHTNRSGSGPLATASFKITTDNISGKDYSYYANKGYISDITLIDNRGNHIQVNGGSDSSQVGFYPNGIPEISTETIRVQPNPAHDRVLISAGNVIDELHISNVMGQEVLRRSAMGSKAVNMDISAFDSGVYFVQIKTAKGSGIVKLVIEK